MTEHYSMDRNGHAFELGQFVTSKSGKLYRVDGYRSANWSRKLKGEIGYSLTGQRNGRDYGPSRLMRESSLRAVS